MAIIFGVLGMSSLDMARLSHEEWSISKGAYTSVTPYNFSKGWVSFDLYLLVAGMTILDISLVL